MTTQIFLFGELGVKGLRTGFTRAGFLMIVDCFNVLVANKIKLFQ
jgi:hypothetical protein